MMKRQSGILMPIFSLPSKYGIGDFGKSAIEFIDFLKESNQKVWQVLPLVETGYGDSPYSSVCSYSFNPYFISPEILYELKLIDKKDLKQLENDNQYI
ncbi:MAG: 4-alpha-glucanotransferase, partial [Firmicutes bacterium]|nr:4-alpha-glucanotransferase [Candidatus Caballimonas caccae]